MVAVNWGPIYVLGRELEEWVWPKVESWAHVVRILAKISKRYPQLSYDGLGMSLHNE